MSVHGLCARWQVLSEPSMPPDVGHVWPLLRKRPQHAGQQLQAALGHLTPATVQVNKSCAICHTIVGGQACRPGGPGSQGRSGWPDSLAERA